MKTSKFTNHLPRNTWDSSINRLCLCVGCYFVTERYGIQSPGVAQQETTGGHCPPPALDGCDISAGSHTDTVAQRPSCSRQRFLQPRTGNC